MEQVTITLYSLKELREQFPNAYEKAVEKRSNIEMENWQPFGDFYFEPLQALEEAALKIALENRMYLVFPTYESYVKAGSPKGAYSPGHSFFRFSEDNLEFDLYRGCHVACSDLQETHTGIFKILLGIPKYLWNMIDVSIEYGTGYHREGKNFLSFSVGGRVIWEDGEKMENISPRLTRLCEKADAIFQNILDNAHTRLREDFEYCGSEEAILEMAESNDWKFTAWGDLW